MRPPPPLPFALLASILSASALPSSARAEDTASAVPVRVPQQKPKAAEDDTRALRFTGGVSLTGLGLITALLGGVLTARAIVSKRDIGTHCNAAAQCDLQGYALGSEVQDFTLIASVIVPIGLAAAAGGLALAITARPSTTGARAWLSPSPRGLSIGGRF